ncbi:MAG: hypothetical protein Q4C43_11700 [Prevotella sp.]|nr:hypothetical protein [Prevotella sp.]
MCGLSFAINVVVLSLKSRDTFYDAKVAKHVDKTVLNGQKTGLFAPFLTQFVIFRPGAGGFPAGFFHRPPDGGPYRQNGGEGAKKNRSVCFVLIAVCSIFAENLLRQPVRKRAQQKILT